MQYPIKYNKLKYFKRILYIAMVLMIISVELFSARIKDIASFQGTNSVQVIGYGLVVGLNQTGDNQLNSYTNQSVINMLKRFGLTADNKRSRMRNVAAVMVTTTIPSFLKKGAKIDVQVASLGDATSLQGGNLLMTPLSTPDGKIIGNAQGAISVGGYDFRSLGSQVSKNFVTAGRVPNGLILSQEIQNELIPDDKIRLSLTEPDFTSITRIQNQIQTIAGLENNVEISDRATVEITLPDPKNNNQVMNLISQIENLEIQIDPVAKVVINERTGTVVIGGKVELLPAVVAHGGLEITIQRQVVVPQPAPFTIIPPRIAESADIKAEEEINQATPLEIINPTVDGIADALNLLQVKPRDLIAIFQALKESGSLQAELVIQ